MFSLRRIPLPFLCSQVGQADFLKVKHNACSPTGRRCLLTLITAVMVSHGNLCYSVMQAVTARTVDSQMLPASIQLLSINDATDARNSYPKMHQHLWCWHFFPFTIHMLFTFTSCGGTRIQIVDIIIIQTLPLNYDFYSPMVPQTTVVLPKWNIDQALEAIPKYVYTFFFFVSSIGQSAPNR